MLATQITPASVATLPTQARRQSQKASDVTPSAATPEQVRNMLLDIAFNLHATRVVGKMRRKVAPKTPVESA